MSKVHPVFFESVFNFSQYSIFQSVMTILLMDGLMILTVTVTFIPKNSAVNGAPKIGMASRRTMQSVPLALFLREGDVLDLFLETVGLLELLRLT
jgi:hypothetical protein